MKDQQLTSWKSKFWGAQLVSYESSETAEVLDEEKLFVPSDFLETSMRYPEEPDQDAPTSVCLSNMVRPCVFSWGLAVLYSARSGLSSIFQPKRFYESMIAARRRLEIRSWHPSVLAGSRALLEAPCCPLVAGNDTGNTRTVFTLWWELD